ncbi:MAG: VTT domain-containing protein [Pseudomonadota bacterium]
MASHEIATSKEAVRPAGHPESLRSLVLTRCIDCPKCVDACAFLKRHGSPKKIALAYDSLNTTRLTLPFECNLCGLCAAVCPVNLAPDEMFLEMRREAVDRGVAPLPVHQRILTYERRGISKRYSWYGLPDHCESVFFPGCTFSGTRADTTIALYEYLETKIPGLGIVLDCCCKPSHDLGRSAFFTEVFGEMKDWLLSHGAKHIFVACPNCYKVIKTYGAPLSVMSVYEFLSENGLPLPASTNGFRSPEQSTVSIHDPCVLRNEATIHTAVRNLAAAGGVTVVEMPHGKKRTVCCGEGGAVGLVAPEFSGKWGEVRRKEAGDRRLLTYCAGCAGILNRKTPTDHILDMVFHPEAVAAGNRRATKPPWTYLNRIRLKRYLQKNHPAAMTRERTYQPSSGRVAAGGGKLKKILILLLIVAVIAGIHFSGLLRYFDPQTLRATVASWGILAPVAYMLLYTLAPALFLPGLPITLAGGILFGPVWGVVYSITGATAGASLAFLISRYVARNWIRAKLTGPRWRQLERNVEKNGWKIVAFTRLVPLFPFNLLNYAFGLTPVRFLPYVVTSFICMLPACIAFIVFSSSLPDLIKGNVSPGFIIGILLMVLVSLMPSMIRKFKRKRGNDSDMT